jgi:hypothetical protein
MNDPILKKAHKRVKAKKGFFVHFGVYISVGMFFLLINIATFHEGREWWFFFPMIPWLVGLMIHYFTVFGLPGTGIMAEGWEEAELEKEVRRLLRQERMESGRLPDLPDEEEGLELKDPEVIRKKDSRWEDKDIV